MDHLTELDKAAICYHVFADCDDKAILFRIAEGENRYNKLTANSKKVTISRWYNSAKIQKGIEIYSDMKNRKIEALKREFLEMLETETKKSQTESARNESVNFLDRDEFLKFLNDRANKISDDKLRNDILKMLSDNLRYKDSETAENNEIQRFYTPKLCENCQIYNKCKDCKLENCPKML